MMRLFLALATTYLFCAGTCAQQFHRREVTPNNSLARQRFNAGRRPLKPALTILDGVAVRYRAFSSLLFIDKPHRTRTVTVTYTLTKISHTSTRDVGKSQSSRTRVTGSAIKKALTQTAKTATNVAATVTRDVSNLDYISKYLEAHNVHRRNHSAPDLVYDADLANSASKIAATCVYQHDTSPCKSGCGQNIGAGFTDSSVASFVGSMYNNEINNYPGPYGSDNIDTSAFGGWGHYSQIVWKSTARVGCATQYCQNGLANTGYGISPYFTVCNYYPPGNFGGQWSEVPAPRGGSTIVFVP